MKFKKLRKPLNLVEAREACKIARERSNGRDPEEIIKNILDNQVDPKIIEGRFKEMEIQMLEKLVKMGRIVCPHCGKTDCLVWSCCDKKVVK